MSKNANNPVALEVTLRKSLESTGRGLEAFLGQLKGAGMAEAVDSYRTLSSVLFQQRLWSDRHPQHRLQPLFERIANVASKLEAILTPYASVMKTLSRLATESPSESRGQRLPDESDHGAVAAAFDPDEAELIRVLCQGFVSRRRLVADDTKRGDALLKLTERGVLLKRGRGGGVSYRLSDDALATMISSASTRGLERRRLTGQTGSSV